MKYVMLITSAVFTIWMLCSSVLEAKSYLIDHKPWHLFLTVVFILLAYWNAKSFIARIPTPPTSKKSKK
jgi:FtsH-binding integral membrane protein